MIRLLETCNADSPVIILAHFFGDKYRSTLKSVVPIERTHCAFPTQIIRPRVKTKCFNFPFVRCSKGMKVDENAPFVGTRQHTQCNKHICILFGGKMADIKTSFVSN